MSHNGGRYASLPTSKKDAPPLTELAYLAELLSAARWIIALQLALLVTVVVTVIVAGAGGVKVFNTMDEMNTGMNEMRSQMEHAVKGPVEFLSTLAGKFPADQPQNTLRQTISLIKNINDVSVRTTELLEQMHGITGHDLLAIKEHTLSLLERGNLIVSGMSAAKLNGALEVFDQMDAVLMNRVLNETVHFMRRVEELRQLKITL